MSSTRTQIYLTEAQRRRVDEVADADGVTMAEVIRRALDAYLVEVRPDSVAVLGSTFGALANIAAPSRDEWERG